MSWSEENSASAVLAPAHGAAPDGRDEPASAESAGPLSPEDLAEVMLTCTRVTEHLHAAHQVLQAEVHRLNVELREKNEQLQRARHLAALGQMAAGIAHEVRNPLGSIRLYASMLDQDLTDRPEARQLARRINRAVTDLDAIVGDVLNFSRQLAISPLPVSPSDVIAQSLHACADLLEDAPIEVVVNDADAPPVAGDANLLAQALCNILRNAIEAIAESNGSHLRIDVQPIEPDAKDDGANSRRQVSITVRDDGPGIAPDVVDRIFNPFFTTRKAGTGLGLAIVHRIIDAHGGQIRIEPVEPHGTALSVILPALKADSPPRNSSDPTEHHP